MPSLRSLILAMALLASAHAFVAPVQRREVICTTCRRNMQMLYSTLNQEDKDVQLLEELGPLALKMAGVLTIKTVKDMVNYPPMLLDQLTRDVSGKNEMSPFVMLAKLMGVLFFKMAHDAVYFPMIWTQRWNDCQSLDECNVE
jgi:hypothetical protein